MPKSRYYMLRDEKDKHHHSVPLKVTHHGVRDLNGAYHFELVGVNGTREFLTEVTLEGKVSHILRMKVGKHNKIMVYDTHERLAITPIDKSYARKLAKKVDFHEKLQSASKTSAPYLEDLGSWSGL